MTANHMTLDRPKHITSLASSGILVTVEISAWTGSKQDRTISDEVATAKKASSEAGRYVKRLLAGDLTHKRLVNHRQTVYNWLRRMAYPWAGDQWYVPTIRIPQFMQEYQKLYQQYQDLLKEFLTNYPSLVSDMAFNDAGMGDMFRREDYPTVEQLKGKFRMNLYTSEVPENDFRNLISKDLADDLHNSYTRQAEAMIDRILSEQAKQLISVLESLSHCCTNETVMGDDGMTKIKRRKIYDTTIQKALELCNTFREFNLTENPHLESAALSLSRILSDVPLEALRESDSTRERVKSEVDDILNKFRPVAPSYEDDEEEGE